MTKARLITSACVVVVLCLIGVLSGMKGCSPRSEPQAKLHKIIGCDNPKRKLAIVFVHGVDGHYMTTWHPSDDPQAYWPRWLGEDNPDIGVWSLDYPVATTPWWGETMNLTDRARNVLSILEAEGFADDPERPLVFVCHSFGGLVVKQILERAEESPSKEWKTVLDRMRGVVFIATPNSGSNLANFVDFVAQRLLNFRGLTTVTVEDLKHDSPQLLKLNQWYRNHAPGYGIRTLVFCEKQSLPGFGDKLVVDESSADPAIAGVEANVLDRNHINICKLSDRDETLYKLTIRFLNSLSEKSDPCDMPDPLGPTDKGGCLHPPSEADVHATPREAPELVVLSCENRSGRKLQVALYDWSRRYQRKKGVWRFLDAPSNGAEKRYEDFLPDSTGWFSIYVVTPDCHVSRCLETVNLFAARKPRIVIEDQAGDFKAVASFDK